MLLTGGIAVAGAGGDDGGRWGGGWGGGSGEGGGFFGDGEYGGGAGERCVKQPMYALPIGPWSVMSMYSGTLISAWLMVTLVLTLAPAVYTHRSVRPSQRAYSESEPTKKMRFSSSEYITEGAAVIGARVSK